MLEAASGIGPIRSIGKTPRPAPVFPTIFRPTVTPRDDAEMTRAGPSRSATIPRALTGARIAGLTFGIEYQSAGDEITRRRITLRRVDRVADGILHLMAFCHEAGALRTFRSDRIRHVFDWQTGEVLEDASAYVVYLGSLADATRSPDAENRRALDRVRDSLRILMFCARVDGRVHPAEAAEVRRFCVFACEEIRPAIREYDVRKLEDYAARLYPDADTFGAAAKRLIKRNWRPLILETLKAAERVILADGIVHEAEEQFLPTLRRAAASWEAAKHGYE